MVCSIRYIVYGIFYMVYSIWYILYGIFYMVYSIWYILYSKDRKNILKMNKEVRMLLPKKDLIQVEYIGKIKNYYEDIYIPPYNNTD